MSADESPRFEMDLLQALKDMQERFDIVAAEANRTICMADEHIATMQESLRKTYAAIGMSEMAALEKAINDAIELRLKALKSHENIMIQINKLIAAKMKSDAIATSRGNSFFPMNRRQLTGAGELDLSELE